MAGGRPSLYSDELADIILSGLVNGDSMRKICEAEWMPDRGTVIRWIKERPDFAAKYAHAREAQADTMDDLILEEAQKATPETAAVARVRIDAFKWRAAKLKPKVYGDAVTLKGDKDNPLQTTTTLELSDAMLLGIAAGHESAQ